MQLVQVPSGDSGPAILCSKLPLFPYSLHGPYDVYSKLHCVEVLNEVAGIEWISCIQKRGVANHEFFPYTEITFRNRRAFQAMR